MAGGINLPRLARRVFEQAIGDFLSIGNSWESRKQRLIAALEAGEFLLEREDPIVWHWAKAADVDVKWLRANPPEGWVARLAEVRGEIASA